MKKLAILLLCLLSGLASAQQPVIENGNDVVGVQKKGIDTPSATAPTPSSPTVGYTAWYDFSAYQYLFTDTAGTTPIANTDGALIKSVTPQPGSTVSDRFVDAGGYSPVAFRKGVTTAGVSGLQPRVTEAEPYPYVSLDPVAAIGGLDSTTYSFVFIFEMISEETSGVTGFPVPYGWGGITFQLDIAGSWAAYGMSGYDSDYPSSGLWTARYYNPDPGRPILTPYIMVVSRNGGTVTIWVNNHKYVDNAVISSLPMRADQWGGRMVFYGTNSVIRMTVLYDLVIYDAALTGTQASNLCAYAHYKTGLSCE